MKYGDLCRKRITKNLFIIVGNLKTKAKMCTQQRSFHRHVRNRFVAAAAVVVVVVADTADNSRRLPPVNVVAVADHVLVDLVERLGHSIVAGIRKRLGRRAAHERASTAIRQSVRLGRRGQVHLCVYRSRDELRDQRARCFEQHVRIYRDVAEMRTGADLDTSNHLCIRTSDCTKTENTDIGHTERSLLLPRDSRSKRCADYSPTAGNRRTNRPRITATTCNKSHTRTNQTKTKRHARALTGDESSSVVVVVVVVVVASFVFFFSRFADGDALRRRDSKKETRQSVSS
jgi:hypothetical protein